MIYDFKGARLDERVGRNDDTAHLIIFDERINDFRQVAAQHRLAAGKPEVCDGWHRLRDLLDLIEGHVAGLIQFCVVKAGLAESIAARSDEENQRAETLFAPCRTQELNELCSF